MADIGVQTLAFSDAAIVPTFAAAAAGDELPVAGDDRVFLAVANGSGASIDVTISAVSSAARVPGVGSVAVPDRVVAVAAAATKYIGPIPKGYVGTNGKAAVSYSATASVTRCGIRVPPQD